MNYYFDKQEYQYAKLFFKVNPYTCKTQMENYINKYQKDYVAKIYYSKILKVLGNFQSAYELLNNQETIVMCDKKLSNDFNKYRTILDKILYQKLRCLCYLEKFDEVEKLLFENKKFTQTFKYSYFYNLVNYSKLKSLDFEGYRLSQLFNYSDEDFLDHIKKHMYQTVEDYDVVSTFNTNFPFEKVFNEVKKNILFSKAYYYGTYEDIYIFKYDKCGVTNGKETDYFLVATFHNTNKYISMYLAEENLRIDYIDLNYLKISNNNNVKRLSQIDKFNSRYKKY